MGRAGAFGLDRPRNGEMAPGLYFAVLRHVSGERRLRVVVLP
jgi:hypothetical protein